MADMFLEMMKRKKQEELERREREGLPALDKLQYLKEFQEGVSGKAKSKGEEKPTSPSFGRLKKAFGK
jgi:hypothetical protein